MISDFSHFFTVLHQLYHQWYGFVGDHFVPTLIIFLFVVFIIIEFVAVTDKRSKTQLIQSYFTNILVFIFNNLLLSLFSISTLLIFAEEYHSNGILTEYSHPVQLLISFVLFDLILYLWHKASHDFESLWFFHKIHHSDKSMNVSTAFRVHFVEVLISTTIKALFIIVTGVEALVVIFCEMVSTMFIMFHHLNISLKSEKWIKWFFIVPSLHRVHHSQLRKEHDSNYGAVFSLWDRLFRTMHDVRQVDIGLVNIKAFTFFELLVYSVFDKPAKEISTNNPIPDNIEYMVAEAAYYKAEKRGFVPGFDTVDWIEAEQEVLDSFGF